MLNLIPLIHKFIRISLNPWRYNQIKINHSNQSSIHRAQTAQISNYLTYIIMCRHLLMTRYRGLNLVRPPIRMTPMKNKGSVIFLIHVSSTLETIQWAMIPHLKLMMPTSSCLCSLMDICWKSLPLETAWKSKEHQTFGKAYTSFSHRWKN